MAQTDYLLLTDGYRAPTPPTQITPSQSVRPTYAQAPRQLMECLISS